MFVEVLFGIILLATLCGVGVILFRHMERVSNIPERQISHTVQHHSIFKQVIQFLASKQKLITAAVLTKIIRRLKIISLKTDNLSSRLLQKLRERQSLQEDKEGIGKHSSRS